MSFVLNRQLSQSIKSNKLIIDITLDDYDKINFLIKKLKAKYKKEINLIIQNKNDFDRIEAHNLLVKSIIKEVINSFKILNDCGVCIFLTGSFARYTNKLNSDLDLHFCYKNKYKKLLFKYEEIIYYILTSIFSLNRGKVHNMILSRFNIKNVKNINNRLDENDLEIILSSSIDDIKYKINGNIKNRIYLQYGNNKDLKKIYQYLKKEILTNNSEWAHVFYIFLNKEEFERYYIKLLKKEKHNLNIFKVESRNKRIVDLIDEINIDLNFANKESICDFKKIFQMKEFKLFYEYISLKRDLYLLKNKGWNYINLYDNNVYLESDNIYKYIKRYLCSLFQIVEPLGNNYSIHKDGYMDKLNFEILEKELILINKCIREELT